MNEVLFVSDLHLDVNNPILNQLFSEFIENHAIHAKRIYILGDLFEAWIGDDDNDPYILKYLEKFKKLSETTELFFICGNRDFLISQQFSENTGITLLPDYYCFELFDHKILLMHGDLLCTDDIEYQKFRAQSRSPQWQSALLSKSLDERRMIASQYRQSSQEHKGTLSNTIMDVNQQTVINTFNEHQVQYIIHGHTHRPDIHYYSINNRKHTRIVLSDWRDYGCYLAWNDQGYEMKHFYLNNA